jgi:hypothetical protein
MSLKDSKYIEIIKDRQSIITILALSLAFVFSTILGFGARFYVHAITDTSFWSDLALSFILCVYCLYFGIPEAKNFYQKLIGGKYQNALKEFKLVRQETRKRDFEFGQWLTKLYQDEKDAYFHEILSVAGITNKQVLDLQITELNELKKPYLKTWENTEFEGREPTFFRAMTRHQISIIRAVMKGDISFSRIPDSFFKTAGNKIVTSEYKQKANSSKESLTYGFLIANRVVMVFVFAFATTIIGIRFAEIKETTTSTVLPDGTVVEETISVGSQVLANLVDTISRYWTMISSFVYGFSLGRLMVTKDTDKLEYKTDTSYSFLNDTNFVAKTEQEVAIDEYRTANNIEKPKYEVAKV